MITRKQLTNLQHIYNISKEELFTYICKIKNVTKTDVIKTGIDSILQNNVSIETMKAIKNKVGATGDMAKTINVQVEASTAKLLNIYTLAQDIKISPLIRSYIIYWIITNQEEGVITDDY